MISLLKLTSIFYQQCFPCFPFPSLIPLFDISHQIWLQFLHFIFLYLIMDAETNVFNFLNQGFAFLESEFQKQKLNSNTNVNPENSEQNRISHIKVECNHWNEMNEHVTTLCSFMWCFYAKRCDQTLIIGRVVDYIHEWQQILYTLESKRHWTAYSEILSPRTALSPQKPP